MKKYFKSLKLNDYIRMALWGIIILLIYWQPIFMPISIVIGALIACIVVWLSNMKYVSRASGNGIQYGSRGKGKGVLLNEKIRKDRTKPFVNVPYHETLLTGAWLIKNNLSNGDVLADKQYILYADTYIYKEFVHGMYYHTELLENISEYFESIAPITTDNFVTGIMPKVIKIDKFEGRNVYIDDINVYMPNWADSLLKKRYPSMPPMLAINRHIYNAYCVITTQDRERPYKILKELQGDFSIKAVKTLGWGWFWQCIPILNKFVYTKYIYHELPKSSDMLPFQAIGVVNEGVKHAYLTSGQATKEVYEATNGIIRYGFVLQLKKHIHYDTRIFHVLTFKTRAPKL